jgi:hypothetical protein
VKWLEMDLQPSLNVSPFTKASADKLAWPGRQDVGSLFAHFLFLISFVLSASLWQKTRR